LKNEDISFGVKHFRVKGINILNLFSRGVYGLAFFVFTHSVFASIYYVDGVGGDNANTGTSVTASFRTLSKANSVVVPGDTVKIRSGTYAEQIKPRVSGTANAKITYTRYQNEVANIIGLDENTNPVWDATPISIGSKSYIVVDNLDFRLQRTTLKGEVVIFGGSNNELRNSRIINSHPRKAQGQRVPLINTFPRTFGVSIKGSNGNILEGNTISGWWAGLKANQARNAIIRNNVIAGNQANQIKITGNGQLLGQLYEGNIIGGSITSDGIQSDSDGGNATAIEIRGVVIRDNYFYFNAENAIDLKAAGDIVIEGNIMVATLHDNDGTGVNPNATTRAGVDPDRGGMGTVGAGSQKATKQVIIRNNTLYDNSGGVSMRGENWKIYNNTFVANNRDINGANSSFDPLAENSANWWENLASFTGAGWRSFAGTSFVNNIVVAHQDAVLIKRDTGTTTLEINNNLYYDAGNPLLFYRGRSKIQKLTPLTFEQWQRFLASESGNIGGDVDSVVAAPLFVNVPSQPDFPFFNFTQPDVENPIYMKVLGFSDLPIWFPYDFSLRSNSPAIDAGKALTSTSNFGSNSTQLRVVDANFFFDGYGIVGEGDVIQIGSAAPVKITGINYTTDVVTLAQARSWGNDDSVSLPYSGTAPDIGAFEFTGTHSINNSPIAKNDSATTGQDVEVFIAVLTNDSDPDSGDSLNVSAVTQGANGTVTNYGTDVAYRPNISFSGSDRFTYTVSDGNGGFDTATVTVTVNSSTALTVTLDPVADVFVQSGVNSTKNFAGRAQLRLKRSGGDWGRESFLKFDLTEQSGIVVSAKLILQVVKDDGRDIEVLHNVSFVADDNWIENRLTWDTKPVIGTHLSQQSIVGLGVYEFDVSSAIQSELGDFFSLSVTANNGAPSWIGYASKEHTTLAVRPTLEITYAQDSRVPSANQATVEIDLIDANGWQLFRYRVTNKSTSANIESVTFNASTGIFDVFKSSGRYRVSPNPGRNQDGVREQTVTLTYDGGLAAGSSDQSPRGDIDGNINGLTVTVLFSDGTSSSGSMINVGDSDDGDPARWVIDL